MYLAACTIWQANAKRQPQTRAHRAANKDTSWQSWLRMRMSGRRWRQEVGGHSLPDRQTCRLPLGSVLLYSICQIVSITFKQAPASACRPKWSRCKWRRGELGEGLKDCCCWLLSAGKAAICGCTLACQLQQQSQWLLRVRSEARLWQSVKATGKQSCAASVAQT